jgi:flagellar biosynthesis/type III secretory pathway chaperone
MAKPDHDAPVLGQIERLAAEEHQLLERGELEAAEQQRLAKVQLELDQCWDLLRQRRALREFGGDPSQAHVRDPETVKKYIG